MMYWEEKTLQANNNRTPTRLSFNGCYELDRDAKITFCVATIFYDVVNHVIQRGNDWRGDFNAFDR